MEELGIKLFGAWKQGQLEVTLWFSPQERQALYERFATRQVIDERHAHVKISPMVLERAMDGCALLEQRERDTE